MKKLRLLPLLIALLAVLGFVLYLRAPQALSGLPKATPVSAPAPGASPAVTDGPEGMPAVTDEPEGMPAVTDEPEETPPRVAPVCLTELMPANKTTMPDADGDFSDWIELTNTGDTAQTLDGCWLSDEKKQPLKWQLPALTLQPGERMLVFCSGKDRREGELHTNFSLGSDGETLLLTAADGYEYWRVRYPDCRSDESIFVEGEELRTGWLCSPGYPDDEQGHEDYLAASDHPGALVINEAVLYNDDFAGQDHQYYDWVELKNVSEEPVLLSDYCLSDDREDRLQFTLPARTLAPGGTFLVFCSGNTRLTNDYYCHAPFALSSKGDSLYLSYADGTLSDYVRVHDLPYLGSCGRMDGQPGFFYFKQRSPKADNVGGFRTVAERPTASPASGVYPGQETLTVELQGEGDIPRRRARTMRARSRWTKRASCAPYA